MKVSTISEQTEKILIRMGVIAIWLLIWQLASVLTGSDFLFPGPVEVVSRLITLAQTKDFLLDCLCSLGRIMLGCLAGIVIGTFMGMITAFSKPLNIFFSPMLTVVKTTPVASFIILLLLWLSRSGVTVTVSAILVTPILWSNITSALLNTDVKMLEMAKMYRFTAAQKLKYIYLPAAKPAFVSGCTTAIGFAWKSGISAEVIALPENAVGSAVYHAKINLEYTDLFAWTLAVIILSLIVEKLLVFALQKLTSGRKTK